MPLDYLEMLYLALEKLSAAPSDKIDEIEEKLGKLKSCGILAVNQLINKEPVINKEEYSRSQTLSTSFSLGKAAGEVSCSVDLPVP